MQFKTLKKRIDFIKISNNGNKIFARNFIFIQTITNSDIIRVGLTASKKIGNAPERNRAKRRLRAALNITLSNVSNKFDCLVIAKKNILSSNFTEILEDMSYSLKKLNLL